MDGAERAVSTDVMDGIHLERDGEHGDLRLSFPGANGKWQVSSAGGEEPRWRQDGKELFYLSAEGKMMAVAVTRPPVSSGPGCAVQTQRRRQPVSSFAVFSYDVSGDGQRFLIITKVDEASAAPLSVFLNWASEMEK